MDINLQIKTRVYNNSAKVLQHLKPNAGAGLTYYL